MAARVKVVVLPGGVAELLRDPGVRADLRRRAERSVESARASAPVDTGRYRDSIQAWDGTETTAYGRYGSDVDYAIYVEADTGNLARALDAAG